MVLLVKQLLWSLARKFSDASPESRTGRLLAELRAAMRIGNLDSRNVAEFEDLWTHERMLSDDVRVDTYARAIAKQIGPDDVVLDLGTGSGILAILAARRARKVYAVDHSDILDVARMVAAANGITNIEFVRSNSRHFTPPEPISVILHEQIGDELYEENMIENVVDLRTRVLRPGGRILPARFTLYIEPIMLKDGYSIPFIWQLNVHGIDYSSLRDRPEMKSLLRSGDLRWAHPLEVDHLLCDPAPVESLDLMTVARDALPTRFRVSKTVTRRGRFDGLYVYIGVDFGDGVGFDTSPSTRTSWGNRLIRVPTFQVEVGDPIAFHVDVPEAREIDSWVVTVESPPIGRLRA
jgi:protein arginine N-methyltransferase 1